MLVALPAIIGFTIFLIVHSTSPAPEGILEEGIYFMIYVAYLALLVLPCSLFTAIRIFAMVEQKQHGIVHLLLLLGFPILCFVLPDLLESIHGSF